MVKRTYDGLAVLARQANALRPRAGGLPGLFILTDPARTPDPVGLASRLPEGAGLILRTFGRSEIEALARPLAAIARRRGLTLLISADPVLAARAGAQGVHWPQWALARAGRPWDGAIVTASAHDPGALRRAQQMADAVLISTVFRSAGASAGRPMGPFRLAAWARRATIPVIALGGMTAHNTGRLTGLGVAGVAAVGAATRI